MGCKLPPPLLWPARTKTSRVKCLRLQQERIKRSRDIVIAGGGALGVQYATDIADYYTKHPEAERKNVTVVHSRDKFLPLYKDALHEAVIRRMRELGINVITGDRVVVPSDEEREAWEAGTARGAVRTQSGKQIECDLFMQCTGQMPNSELLAAYAPSCTNDKGFVLVDDELRVVAQNDKDRARCSHIFAVGDVAEAGVIKAGHTGWNQAEVAVENVLALINGGELKKYKRTPPQIKVTLGLEHSVSQLLPSMDAEETIVQENDKGPIDGYWQVVWQRMAADTENPHV